MLYRDYDLISPNPLIANQCRFLKFTFSLENTKNNIAGTPWCISALIPAVTDPPSKNA